MEQEYFLDVDYDKNGNAIQPLLSELIKNFSKANTKTPEFRPFAIFEPTQNPRKIKTKMLVYSHSTGLSFLILVSKKLQLQGELQRVQKNMLLKQIPFLLPPP